MALRGTEPNCEGTGAAPRQRHAASAAVDSHIEQEGGCGWKCRPCLLCPMAFQLWGHGGGAYSQPLCLLVMVSGGWQSTSRLVAASPVSVQDAGKDEEWKILSRLALVATRTALPTPYQ